ncbi:unnamed protein product [Malus baccata var. baccata]
MELSTLRFDDLIADETAHSRYVKLTKEQAPTEDINPASSISPSKFLRFLIPHSLSFSLDRSMNVVARTTVHLDSSSSLTGLFCPCVLFGRNVESLRDDTPWNRPCICHAICIEGGLVRQSLRKKYHLKNSPCDPCLTHCCLHWCALCQEHMEMKGRLKDDDVMLMTVINLPQVQQMKSADNNQDSAALSSTNNNGHTNMEMQAL